MTAALMVYGLSVSLLFGLTALALERILAMRGWPRRGLWILSLAASFAFPAMSVVTAPVSAEDPSVIPMTVPRPMAEGLPAAAVPAAASNTALKLPSPALAAGDPTGKRRQPDRRAVPLEDVLTLTWVISSVVLSGLYSLGWLKLHRLVRSWPVVMIDGVSVRLAERAAPAVFGCWRPQIVVPRWVISAPPAVRNMVLAHEREHVAARDPMLLHGALLLILLAPWNLPVWWQLRRLRFALEVDCDARVLQGGTEVLAYAEMLFSISRHRFDTSLGTITLGDGASQLERRIHLLVGETRRHGKMLIGMMGAFAVSLVVMAAELHAPALHSTELRKLPPEDMTLGAEWARDAARERFPELFENAFAGTAVVSLAFNFDGSLLRAQHRIFPPGTTPTGFGINEAVLAAGAEQQDVAYGGEEWERTIGPWLSSSNAGRIDIVYAVLKWPIDPARSAARVKAAVQARFPESFDPFPGNPHDTIIITAFMNEDGTVNRARKEVLSPPIAISADDRTKQFAMLGVSPGQIGRTGEIQLRHGSVWYAWPARPQDEAIDVARHRLRNVEKTDDADDSALIKRYFPDAATHQVPSGERRWILLGRDGHVWGTGHGVYPNSNWLQQELEARFPGIHVTLPLNDCLGATPAEREALRMYCVWLTPDSPITDRADVNPRSRPDVFLAGVLAVDGADPISGPSVPFSVSLKFGTAASPTGSLCQHAPAVAYCPLRFIAQRAGDGRVQLTSGLQSLPGAGEVTIGGSYNQVQTVTLVDGDSKPWRIALRPIRLD